MNPIPQHNFAYWITFLTLLTGWARVILFQKHVYVVVKKIIQNPFSPMKFVESEIKPGSSFDLYTILLIRWSRICQEWELHMVDWISLFRHFWQRVIQGNNTVKYIGDTYIFTYMQFVCLIIHEHMFSPQAMYICINIFEQSAFVCFQISILFILCRHLMRAKETLSCTYNRIQT